MSRVTDRLDNKQIVELAKQQYENRQQTSKFPANIITLPSNGNVYTETSALRSGKVEMRHMTAYDEDILSNSSYIKEGVIFDKLLEALIITADVNINDLTAGDKEWLIISARILGYGVEYDVVVTNPQTNKPTTGKMDLSKLKHKVFDEISDENGCFNYTVPITNDVIKFKYLSSYDSFQVNSEKLTSSFLKLSIQSVNGNDAPQEIEDYLKYDFKAIDSRKFKKHIIETAPSIDYNIKVIGADGDTIDATFQFNADLFWF
tara:strand:+ start:2585 stop:3367 length:783 start_codon:yes stop_codon:yes gene_type:complete